MARLIAITGGIGSGKSTVCKSLQAWGLMVYDCDSRAKALMDSDTEIHTALRREIADKVVRDGVIDRPLLSKIVFADPDKLRRLNGIVHHHVTADLRRWARRHAAETLLFVETAILLESNLHTEVDEVWVVEASENTRVERAVGRDGCHPEEVLRRLRQQRAVSVADVDVPLRRIDNEGTTPLLPQLADLLAINGLSLSNLPGQWRN